jgi:predicted transposase/invertase (TIGR01784 family)
VTFCAYTIFPGDDRFFRTGRMRDEAGNVLTDDITMAFVELAKAARLAKKPVGELSPLEMWSIFFGYANRPRYRKVIREIFERRKEVDMAGTLLKSISKDEQERAIFRSRRMAQTDRESDRVTAEKRGEKRGVELERKRGEKQRDAERRKTVRVLKSEGVPVDLISKATGMTPEEITKTGRR